MVKQFKIFYIITIIILIGLGRVMGISRVLAESPISPSLGTAESFGILAGTYSNGASSATITGDIGYLVAPGVAPTSTNPPHVNDSTYNSAGIDQTTALNSLNNQACTFTFPAGAIELSTYNVGIGIGIYPPGIYCISAAAAITAGITLSGDGTYIFRISGALTTAASTNVILSNGALAKNVWWTPSGSISLGASSNFIGNAFSDSVTLGASVSLIGRAISFNGTITTGAGSIITIPTYTPPTSNTGTGIVQLETAKTFSILSNAYVNGVTSTIINGNIGYLTPPGVTPTSFNLPHVNDQMYDSAGIDQNLTLNSLNNLGCTYTFPAGAIELSTYNVGMGIGIYPPGVYCISAAASITTGVTFSGSGSYVFKITGALTTAASTNIILSNDVSAGNIWWVPSGAVSLGANSDFIGTAFSDSITIGASVLWTGRAIAFDGTVTTGADSIITVDLFVIAPDITSINFASGALLPGGIHNLVINYYDAGFGINTSSDIMSLYKWNGTSWGNDISGIGLNMGSKIITNSGATYPTNNLLFGKYKYNFTISDNPTNSSSIGSIFYIDAPEITVSTGNLDIGNLSSTEEKFSEGEITITVKTVGAGFDLILKKSQLMQNINGDSMTNWNGSKGVGYDTFPYSNTINKINIYEILANEGLSVNINGNKNIYTYKLKMGSFIDTEQAAGIYQTTVDFGIDLNY